ncbi:hypothetical protein [Sphingopyxis sp.]|jgi:hypothetical protein|uniref:hypothetical protein n=1 Tax=Sphingopyxis sp. TaxID=1908224 RepID=UPI003F6FCA22
MADIICNISKGRFVEFYWRVKNNDPANSAFVIVPLETSGLESDAVLRDKDSLADLLSGTTNEQTTMGRKVLTDAELAAFPAADDTNDRYDVALPDVDWTGATGNAISKVALCLDKDTTSGTDSDILPIGVFDFAQTPSGATIRLSSSIFGRAS